MKLMKWLSLLVICASLPLNGQQQVVIKNPSIDMDGYLRVAADAARHRESHRVSESDFLQMSQEPGTIILDARSAAKYNELHVKGAINLSFPDIAIQTLRETIPDKSTRILIYCNNNFSEAEGPFPSKLPTASLNLSTYIVLYNYGYRNVFELAPKVRIRASQLPFESFEKADARRAPAGLTPHTR
jgi:hypothetical protein